MLVMTGANGQLGRLVAKELAKRGAASRTRLATRDPDKVADLVALGFQSVRADFSDRDSMRAAFDGAEAALMISMPGPIEQRIPRHRNAFDAVKDAGVGRLVYTSRVNPTRESLYPFAGIHVFSEEYMAELGLTTTIVRNNEYMENIVGVVKASKDPTKLMLPGATGKVAYIAVADIAEILAKLLLEDGHAGKVYELNGPEAISRDDIAALIAEATNRPTIALPIDGEEFAQIMQERGLPPFLVEMGKGLHKTIDAGEFAKVWPDAPMLLGRPTQNPRDFIRKAFAPVA